MELLQVTNHPQYLIIQMLRMNYVNRAVLKNNIQVHVPDIVVVDRIKYEVIGSITHQGTAYAGHNRAFLKQNSTWFRFEDSRPSVQRKPIDMRLSKIIAYY